MGEFKSYFKEGMPPKKTPKPIKRTSIKKKFKVTGEGNVFENIITNLPDDKETVCFVCGTKIALLMPHNFAHVLSKGKYTKFRLNEENIVLLCHKVIADKDGQGCHHAYDFRPHSELKGDGWERLFEKREELKEQYKKL